MVVAQKFSEDSWPLQNWYDGFKNLWSSKEESPRYYGEKSSLRIGAWRGCSTRGSGISLDNNFNW